MIDITRRLATSTAAWPGDTGLRIDWSLHLSRGGNVSVPCLTFSPHVGTHADAPAHYRAGGSDDDALELERFLGPVRIVDVTGASRVTSDLLEARDAIGRPRLFVRSLPEVRAEDFVSEFPPLDPEAARRLVDAGLLLFGTDAPSVDPVESAEISAHRALGAAGVPILENLDLSAANPGDYDLVALPIRLVGVEAAPVRAILLPAGSLNQALQTDSSSGL